MAVAGRVAIVPKGEWSANATYKRLDAVTHNNTLYFAKKNVPAGTVTSNTEYWSKSIAGGASAIATTEDAGVVKPDGKSMSVDESGTLSINLDGTTITLDEAKNVIKLADALKDKIGSALQPESIVNNQVTTETGYALDARQANPNLDGTLAKQISDLNGSLENLNNFTDILKNDNLNDSKFFNVGKYRCSYNVIAETVLNSPFNTAFIMETFLSTGIPGYNAQKAIEFVSGHCKWRMKEMATGNIVQDWVQLY